MMVDAGLTVDTEATMTDNSTPGAGPEQDAIERVAKAICESEFDDLDPAYAWGVQDDAGMEVYRRQARAAIAAMPVLPVAVTEASERIADLEAQVTRLQGVVARLSDRLDYRDWRTLGIHPGALDPVKGDPDAV